MGSTQDKSTTEARPSEVRSPSLLAEEIEEMLQSTGAFRQVLPMHLDRHKFRWIARHDIQRVIENHIAANARAHPPGTAGE